jgi:hypothetical protein
VPESKGRKTKAAYTPPPPKKERGTGVFASGRWVAPTMVTLFVIGLAWIVVYYIAPTNALMAPLGGLWNVIIGFTFIAAGFIVATRWK